MTLKRLVIGGSRIAGGSLTGGLTAAAGPPGAAAQGASSNKTDPSPLSLTSLICG